MRKVIIIIATLLASMAIANQPEEAVLLTHYFASEFNTTIMQGDTNLFGKFDHDIIEIAKMRFDTEIQWSNEFNWVLAWLSVDDGLVRMFTYNGTVYNLFLIPRGGNVYFAILENK